MTAFQTDEMLARPIRSGTARVRAVARELRSRDVAGGAGVLGAFALELEDAALGLEAVALILDPECTPAATASMKPARLPGV